MPNAISPSGPQDAPFVGELDKDGNFTERLARPGESLRGLSQGEGSKASCNDFGAKPTIEDFNRCILEEAAKQL